MTNARGRGFRGDTTHMMIRKFIAGAMLALLFLSACEDEAVEPLIEADPATARTIDSGEIVGFVEANGAHVWRGVPFGADTSGENRWRAPQTPQAWDGVRQAITWGDACPQIATPFTPIPGFVEGRVEGSEDCLTLDVYAPPQAVGRRLPVMVWIHGGSNVSGASRLYRGHRLAVNEDVIVMAVQYRLGPLGFFAGAGEGDDAGPANFALLDLIAALEWVQRNAEAFGGDPENVTIFGESAGAHNVAGLLASPLADGLFHRAILQSGLVDSASLVEARGAEGDLPNPSDVIVERLGGAGRLRTATLAQVFDAYDVQGGIWLDLPRMIEDGVTLPPRPLADALADPSAIRDVPLIMGTNRDEMKLFYAFDDRLTKSMFSVFRVPRDGDVYDASSDYSGRVWRVLAVDQPAAAMVSAGKDDIYAYRFDWDEGGRFLFMDFSKLLGAAHAMEIPFVFNLFSFFGEADPFLFSKKNEDTREELSRAMGAYWASFARDGIPSADGQPTWQAYGTSSRSIIFDSEADQGVVMTTIPDGLAQIADDLRADDRLNTEERCALAAALRGWGDDAADAFALEECQPSAP